MPLGSEYKTMGGSKKKTPFHSAVYFDDTAVAFRHKADREVLLSYLIFSLTKHPLLVKCLSKAAKVSLSMGLPIKWVIKATVFKQFCGGETEAEYLKVIRQLSKAGIGAILDYSVEGGADASAFERTLRELLRIIHQARFNSNIPCTCMKMTGIGAFDLYAKVTAGKPLSAADRQEWKRVTARLDRICKAAYASGKPIYIDAEESWIQGAIDGLVEEMMEKYNREKAIVFATLQMFRLDRLAYLNQLITRAKTGSFLLGIKLVRGAYLEQERERARHRGYPSPIHPTKEATDRAFDAAIALVAPHIDFVAICLGTHNERSCRLLVRLLSQSNLPQDHPHIYFSQLYGMSDHISYNLALGGYNVSKYLPYGPVEATLPYLARRAEENTAIAGQMGKELEIITREWHRRKRKGKSSRG